MIIFINSYVTVICNISKALTYHWQASTCPFLYYIYSRTERLFYSFYHSLIEGDVELLRAEKIKLLLARLDASLSSLRDALSPLGNGQISLHGIPWKWASFFVCLRFGLAYVWRHHLTRFYFCSWRGWLALLQNKTKNNSVTKLPGVT